MIPCRSCPGASTARPSTLRLHLRRGFQKKWSASSHGSTRPPPGGAAAITHAPVRATIAHLYFESIHPFEDGNGRIGRALLEMTLSQGHGRPAVLSLSGSIDAVRNGYYDALKAAQRSSDSTAWLHWFVGVVMDAPRDAEAQICFVLRKSKFFRRYETALNERELKVMRRMFDAGPDGFSGGMNARKYISLTGASKATATRDLQHLAERGALIPLGGGRSTRYELAELSIPIQL